MEKFYADKYWTWALWIPFALIALRVDEVYVWVSFAVVMLIGCIITIIKVRVSHRDNTEPKEH